MQISLNENNLGGYTEQQLCVQCKYPSYKEEILSRMNMDEYVEIMTKSEQYHKSKKIRSTRPNLLASAMFRYGIYEILESIKLEHVNSLILYCDYSAYCTEFSSTFRKMSPTESIESAKKRNSEFWWQSRLFREMVECYGLLNDDDLLSHVRKPECGPFYTGLNAVLAVPEFAIRLCSPTSTSKQIAVSLNFAKRKGMILQLNNPGTHVSAALPFFNVSWISRFSDEDERVFAGLISICSMECISCA